MPKAQMVLNIRLPLDMQLKKTLGHKLGLKLELIARAVTKLSVNE